MPAVSRRQWKYMQMIAHGKSGEGSLTPAKAREYIAGQSPKGLPEKARKKRG